MNSSVNAGNPASTNDRAGILSAVFSEKELQIVAKVCSIDSLSIKFDWTQIAGIHTSDGIIRVFFQGKGMWMMSIDQFKRLKVVAEAQGELENTLEFHARSVIAKGTRLNKVA